MPIDIDSLWDYSSPEVSERRFRTALEQAAGDETLILHTQIARTYGLRKDFGAARQLLSRIEAEVASSGPEAQARFHLELGRTFASATHSAELLTPEATARARAEFTSALEVARASGLDGLAIDAIHMFAFVDRAPADQLKWGEEALRIVTSSGQRDARLWEPSIRHNVGYALHQLERYEEALAQFQAVLAIWEQKNHVEAARDARWMVAWSLRGLARYDEAIQIQLSLEREWDAVGRPDPYVFEELEALYRAKGEIARAQHYAERRVASQPVAGSG